MIKSFKDKGLAQFAKNGSTAKLSVQKPDRIRRILEALDAATAPRQMDVAGWRFHELTPKYPGLYAVTVSGNHRIIFRFSGQDAVDVELVDYH
jgi:proteic killer suppression protein